MCEREWVRFRNDIAYRAYFRLTAFLEKFCEEGADDLPRRSFRWLSRSAGDHGSAREGTFEAHGVVIHGRHGVTEGRDTFFVTGIAEDPSDGEPAPNPPPADRQHRLPFNVPKRT
jgi:hypothetical protein